MPNQHGELVTLRIDYSPVNLTKQKGNISEIRTVPSCADPPMKSARGLLICAATHAHTSIEYCFRNACHNVHGKLFPSIDRCMDAYLPLRSSCDQVPNLQHPLRGRPVTSPEKYELVGKFCDQLLTLLPRAGPAPIDEPVSRGSACICASCVL